MSRGLRRSGLVWLTVGLLGWSGARAEGGTRPMASGAGPPNVVLVLADDLGVGDLANPRIPTPALDRLAAEGVVFTSFYAGSSVCAPSRHALMTGMHTARGPLRGNARIPLTAEERTLAEVLGSVGLATGGFGKWGLGTAEDSGAPTAQGFDHFVGYHDQSHAHTNWPDHLFVDRGRLWLPNLLASRTAVGAGAPIERHVRATDWLLAEARAFVRTNASRPFFLYYAPTLPHANSTAGNLEPGPGLEALEGSGSSAARAYAALVHELDRHVGALRRDLEELGLWDRTLFLFTSDNGPHAEGGVDPAELGSAGGLRGHKRDLYEGGLRVPLIVRVPGRSAPAQLDEPLAIWDLLPTLAQLVGARSPEAIDGRSALASLEGGERPAPSTLVWELHAEGTVKRAARRGHDKWVQPATDAADELYDLSIDPRETRNLAEEAPARLQALRALFEREHADDPRWPREGRAVR